MVTGVGFLVHLFSLAYMKDDSAKARYFCGLSLFMFSMTGIVLASNFIMMFIFWELVGLSSYLLIGHWYEKDSAADAAKKAFLTNRIGDFGFMIGILMLWGITGTFTFDGLSEFFAATPEILAFFLGTAILSSSWERWVNQRKLLFTSGFQMPWKAPLRFPLSFTPPPWLQPVSS